MLISIAGDEFGGWSWSSHCMIDNLPMIQLTHDQTYQRSNLPIIKPTQHQTYQRSNIIIIIIIIGLTSIFFQDKSRVWTAASQQHLVDNQPLATFWDLSFSHRDASISRKSRLDTIRQLSIPGKVGASFWWCDALLHQPVGIWEDTRIWKPLQR